MFEKIKKNYFILIITFLFIYFFFNLLGGDRGLISYLKKKEIYEELKIKQTDFCNGIVVQLVRTPACQAGGREFKSRRSR